ncbi:cuticle protein 76-like [Bacillus rossius redtenbacheri]|uniref:cuticle protein 76-like n=1 Tax=Bacillus rossius redtenbacheri TaxID=93214 RepID=UPI002FDCE2E0
MVEDWGCVSGGVLQGLERGGLGNGTEEKETGSGDDTGDTSNGDTRLTKHRRLVAPPTNPCRRPAIYTAGRDVPGTVQQPSSHTPAMHKFIVLAAVMAVTKAGYLGAPAVAAYGAPGLAAYAAPGLAAYAAPALAPAAITSQHSNILRTPGNLGQVSTYSKTIDTPYSSVSKSDVRVSNPGVAYGAAYHAPIASYGAYAAPALAARAYAPAAYAAPALAAHAVAPAGLLGVAYSAAPVVSHVSVAGLGAAYGW